MDPGVITSLVIGIVTLVGLLVALRSKRKSGPQKVEELSGHLQMIGVGASVRQNDAVQSKRGRKDAIAVINLEKKNIDSINVVGVASQYGVQYYLDFNVTVPGLLNRDLKKRTKMTR
jgi:hypothetical protein